MKANKNNRIFVKQWLELKPYDNQVITDIYYIKIANEIRNTISNRESIVLSKYLNEEEVNILACFLASYFEDIISETNIWNTFTNYHYKLYNKKLPFFNISEYYENEINEPDVSFLIWYFLNTIQEDKFISPFNDFIQNTASKVMSILEKEYEYAPENLHLKSFYELVVNESDYYKVRNLINTILFKTYLFFPDTYQKLKHQEKELTDKKDLNLLMYLRENRDNFIHKTHTRLLALKGNEWAAELLWEKHPITSDLLNISQRIKGYFFYKGQDDSIIRIEHIASGKSFELTKKSFDHYSSLKEIDTIIYLGIVQWQNEWWFSGISTQIPFNPDFVIDEKNSLESRMETNFLDHKEKETEDMLKAQMDSFLKLNNGSQIAFMKSENLNDFVKQTVEHFNESLNLTEKEKQDAKKRARKDGFFGAENKEEIAGTNEFESCLYFFNPKTGGEIALGINSAFPLENNPFYNTEESENDVLHLFMAENLSAELAMFCINKCKDKVPFLKEGIGKQYMEDIDFLLRFWKKEFYHSRPSITFYGQIKASR